MSAGNRTVADGLAAALARHGVSHLFGQSIPSALHLAAPEHGIAQVGIRTEKAAAMLADGYARVSGRVGVATSIGGPGAVLLAAGLAEAHKASVPVVALVQDVARAHADRNAAQDMDQHTLLSACAKLVRRVETAERVDDYVDLAFVAAASGRPGPAVLLLPEDLLGEPLPARAGAAREASLGRWPLDRPVADPRAVAEAARLLAGAREPLLVAGGGVHGSGACAALEALAERAAIPVATTTMGKGAIDEGHPLALGTVGYAMGPRAVSRHHADLIARADVVLLVGTRTNQNGTDGWQALPPGARYVHVDADPQEIGRNYEALRLAGDARATLEALLAALDAEDLAAREDRRAALEAAIAAARERHAADVASVVGCDAAPLRPERIMAAIDARLTGETVVVADASYATIWMTNYLRARRTGARFISPRGLAGIGWGYPLALGAKLAAGDAPVVCVAGDGGFAHAWAELETARRLGIAVALVVLNNGVLGYQKDAEDARWHAHTPACELTAVDHAAIARACGCLGIRVERAADLDAALDAALAAGAPALVDVVTDPRAFPPITAFEGRLAETG